MKVLHVSPSYFPAFVYGGPIRSTHQQNLALAAQGAEVRVLTTDANGPQRLAESGSLVKYGDCYEVRYERRSFPPDLSLGLLWSLPGAVSWADVVHLTAIYSFTTFPTLFWAGIFEKPLFWSPRGALQDWHGSPRRGMKSFWIGICKLLAGSRVTIVAASGREADAAKALFPGLRSVVIENGVQLPTSVVRRIDDVPQLLFLGRIHRIKAIENLLGAVARLRNSGTPVKLVVAGPGEESYVRSLRNIAAGLNVADVEFIGAVEEDRKEALFSQSDLLVLPSYSENFGLVVAEALAHGVPVVVTRHAPWDQVEEKGCGRWVENDAEGLASGIADVLRNDPTKMGERGREWMRSEFSWAQKASKLCDYYQEASRQ